ncbi:MAG: hypothetical protein LBN97_03605 [Oscillospiraceae bacterium]|jgi:hypothetical protein|nr:hypothetical protein [Oscillospiraceae bacterium]
MTDTKTTIELEHGEDSYICEHGHIHPLKLNANGELEECFSDETNAALQEADDILSGKIESKAYTDVEELLAELHAYCEEDDNEVLYADSTQNCKISA